MNWVADVGVNCLGGMHAVLRGIPCPCTMALERVSLMWMLLVSAHVPDSPQECDCKYYHSRGEVRSDCLLGSVCLLSCE